MKKQHFTGLSCEETQRLFKDLLSSELDRDVERRGRVRGHMLVCEPCALAFGDAIAEAMEEGLLAVEDVLPLPAPPLPVLEAIGVRHRSGGRVWTKLQPLAAEGVHWAKEEIDRVRSALQGLMQVLSPLQVQWEAMGFRTTMGEAQEAWPEDVSVKVVDPSGKPQERSVRFKVVKPPTVTQAGDFLLIMHTDEAGLESRKLLCTVTAVEGVKVTFESELQEEATVRWRAAEALGRIGDASAVPALIETLKDEDVAIRQAAAGALRQIGDPSVVPALAEILKDKGEDKDIHQAAAEALREVGKPRWWAIIRAEGLPACEKDVVIPYDQVRLSLQGD